MSINPMSEPATAEAARQTSETQAPQDPKPMNPASTSQDTTTQDATGQEAAGQEVTGQETEEPVRRRRPWLIYLALAVFAAFIAVAVRQLLSGGNPSLLPSALIGKDVPHFTLPAVADLGGRPGLSDKDLRQGHVTVLNVFASWCVPCHQEEPLLMALAQNEKLAQEGVEIVGIAYKDQAENIRRFLGLDGDPYARVGADTSGRVGIDFGVYGVPETYIITGNGKVAYKLVGPMDKAIMKNLILPQIEKARAASARNAGRPHKPL